MPNGIDTARAMKRRGILAAAGAVMAGIVAKQAAQSVAANNGDPLILGNNSNRATTPTDTTGLFNPNLTLSDLVFESRNYANMGFTQPPQTRIAIVGYVNDTGANGTGDTTAELIGVMGQANRGVSVYGLNGTGYGVYGESTTGIGVFGQTDAAGNIGVLGSTTAPNSIALGGIANTDGSSCFSGGTSNPNAFAAFFQGHVQVTQGAFDVIPLGNKHGLAPHPDGSHRTFYSVESPECWVEDFGRGTLTAGKASIALDKDFATLVHTDDYHVFITEHGGHNGLHTTTKTASGFTVEAAPHVAKAAGLDVTQVSGAFSWRIVAKPKTTANVERLAKAIVGDPKVLIPDAAKLPPRPAKAPPSAPSPKKA